MAKLYRFLRFQERQTQQKCCWQLPEIPVYANEPGISANELTHAGRPYELTSTVLLVETWHYDWAYRSAEMIDFW